MANLVKGVNKNVIELGDTGNQYYDKAILFLKPEYADVQHDVLEKEAKKLLKQVGITASIKRKNKYIYWFIRLSLSAGLGAAITAIVMTLSN